MKKFRVTYKATIDCEETFTIEVEAENEVEAARKGYWDACSEAIDWELGLASDRMSEVEDIETTEIKENNQ